MILILDYGNDCTTLHLLTLIEFTLQKGEFCFFSKGGVSWYVNYTLIKLLKYSTVL